MNCPKCNGGTKICDTRHEKNENETFRSRICKDCSYKFFTVEFEIENDEKFNSVWKKLNRSLVSKQKDRAEEQ